MCCHMHLHKFRTVHSADDKITTTSRKKTKKKSGKTTTISIYANLLSSAVRPSEFRQTWNTFNKIWTTARRGLLPSRLVGRLLGRLLGWSVGLLLGWFIGRLVDLLQHLHTRSSFFHANNSLTICFCFLLSFLPPSLYHLIPYFLQLRLEGGRECAAGYSPDVRRSICAARVRWWYWQKRCLLTDTAQQ